MKTCSLFVLLVSCLLSLCSLGQGVPNTSTFGLTDVTAVTGGTSLSSAFTNSTDSYFDATYKGSKDRLSNFRNYGVSNAVPTVTTSAITSNTGGTVVCGGNVTSQGGSAVTDRGVTWATTLGGLGSNKTHDGTGTGSFTSTITGLTSGQTYYYAAFATNTQGTSTGIIYQFTAN
jgi:hypothetical protein